MMARCILIIILSLLGLSSCESRNPKNQNRDLALTHTASEADKQFEQQLEKRFSTSPDLKAISSAGLKISNIPLNLFKFDKLEYLNLSRSLIREIPKDISNLKSLKEIHLGETKLKNLPETFSELRNLEKINLNGVCLQDRDFDILAKLPNLKNLSYDSCESLPKTFWKLQSLQTFSYAKGLKLLDFKNDLKLAGLLPNLTELRLSGRGLQILPPEIGELKSLKNLDLSHNYLKSLPQEFAKLQKLESVTLGLLHPNHETKPWGEFPTVLFDLPQLKSLIIHSKLTALPNDIHKLKNLEHFEFSSYHLFELPENLGEMTQLKTLNLSNTAIKKVPDSLLQLQNLEVLKFTYNDNDAFHKELVSFLNKASFPKLKELGIGGIPFLFSEDFAFLKRFPTLEKLDLKNNALQKVPSAVFDLPRLKVLDVAQNRIESMPEQIYKFQKVYFHANPLSETEVKKLQSHF